MAWVLGLIVLVTAHTSVAEAMRFQRLYDHYFPNNEYQNGEYRRWFDKTLFGSAPTPDTERHSTFYAFRGDPAAFHAFVRHPDRNGEGEFTLTWNKECLLLLLRLGDERFSTLLRNEDQNTREVVGTAIDCQVDWTRHAFPKTRALYSSRYIRPSQQILEKRHGNGVRRLIASLAEDKRFVGVRV